MIMSRSRNIPTTSQIEAARSAFVRKVGYTTGMVAAGIAAVFFMAAAPARGAALAPPASGLAAASQASAPIDAPSPH